MFPCKKTKHALAAIHARCNIRGLIKLAPSLYTQVALPLELLSSRYLSSPLPLRPLSLTFLSKWCCYRVNSSATRISRVYQTSRPWYTLILSSQCRKRKVTGIWFCSALSVVPLRYARTLSLVDHSLIRADARKDFKQCLLHKCRSFVDFLVNAKHSHMFTSPTGFKNITIFIELIKIDTLSLEFVIQVINVSLY